MVKHLLMHVLPIEMQTVPMTDDIPTHPPIQRMFTAVVKEIY